MGKSEMSSPAQMPWEKYGTGETSQPPWQKYSSTPTVPQNTDAISRGLAGVGRGVAQLGETIAHPLDAIKSLMPPTLGDTAKMDLSNPMENARQLPIVGPMLRGDIAGGIGEALPQAALAIAGPKIARGGGALMRAGAEPLAESALGIRAVNRAYNRNPGAAALDETAGVRPGTVAESARSKLEDINKQLEGTVAASSAPADLTPARTTLQNAEMVARGRNAASTVKQLQPMQQHLNTDFNTGAPIQSPVSPTDLLNLKRGFADEFVNNWNPETMKGIKGTAGRVYHSLADTLHSAVPESQALDERSSSLIPVAERAESADRNAGMGQRIMHRVGAHTGALAGAALGFHEGGVPGGIAGLVIPEMMASPTAKMIAARTLNAGNNALKSPISGAALRTLPALTLIRETNKKQDAK